MSWVILTNVVFGLLSFSFFLVSNSQILSFKDFYLMFVIVEILCFLSRNLPAKPAEEAQKHRQQYEEMVVQAKKRGNGSHTCCLCQMPQDCVSFRRFFLPPGALDPELW